MKSDQHKVYLFVHTIWRVKSGQPLLTKPVRTVLLSAVRQTAAAKGINIITINGVEDHVHCLLQLHPAQNLSQVTNSLRDESCQWLNENKILDVDFEWQEAYAAYSVSPSGVKQVTEYIQKQEEHHKTKTLENELEVFEKVQF